MDAGIFVGILVPLGAFAMVFGIVYLKKKENLAMIEKGMNPKENVSRPAPFRSLKTGLLFTGAGVGLLLAYLIDTYATRPTVSDPAALYFSFIAIGGGLGLIRSYSIEKKHWYDKEDPKQQ